MKTIQQKIDSNIKDLLDDLLQQIQKVLNKKLVGLYLYGSLVTEDFDHEFSDIDLLAVINADINEKELES